MALNEKWPGWETVRLIGRGSFGAIYEIQRQVFDDTEKAALKVISIPQNPGDIDEMYSDGYDDASISRTLQDHLKSIVAEYSLMSKMKGCPNVVNCDDLRYEQHEDGLGWDVLIRMELLTPLVKALPAVIPEEMVIRIAKDMCCALMECKTLGIIHRDIKPQNIFLSKRGEYKLGDFGIAKIVEKTMGGTRIGTFKYMAPEVFRNQPYGSAADIYSLGLVLYWLLNERRMPFVPLPPAVIRASDEESARSRRLLGEAIPAPKNGSEELKKIVLKACAFDPKDRYASAEEMLEDLNRLGVPSAVHVPAPEPVAEDPPAQEDLTMNIEPSYIPEETLLLNEEPSAVVEEPKQDIEPPAVEPEEPAPYTKKQKKKSAEKSARRHEKPHAKKKPVLPVIAACVILAAGLLCYQMVHIWKDATCETPKTCMICGKTQGEELGHQWTKATCVEGSVCTLCGEAGMPAYGHLFDNGSPSTCIYCGAKESDSSE